MYLRGSSVMLIDPREKIRDRNLGWLGNGPPVISEYAEEMWRAIESQGFSIPPLQSSRAVGRGGVTRYYRGVTPGDYVLHQLPLPAARGPRPSDESWFVDKWAYLRTVLANHDWQGVGRWYQFEIAQRMETSTNVSNFWDLAMMDLRNFTDEVWDFGDMRGFMEYVFNPYVIVDLKGERMGLGAGGSGNLDLSQRGPTLYNAINGMFRGERKPPLALGWVQEPGINWSGVIFNLVAGGIVGAGVFAAYSAIASGIAASQAAAAGATAAASTPVVTAAAPAVFAAPAIVAPAAIDTIMVFGTVPAAISSTAAVSGALAAGAIAVAAAPAPLSAPAPQVNAGEPIPEIFSTATRLPPVSLPAAITGAGAGAVIAAVQPPAPFQPAEPVAQENPPESTEETSGEEEPTMIDSVRNSLTELASTMGFNYVRDYLAQLLADRLGRQPTDAEILAYDDYLTNQGSFLNKAAPWILALVAAGAVYTSRKKKGVK